MTVAIPEAAGGLAAGDAAGGSRAASTRARLPARQSKPTPAQMGRPGPTGQPGRAGTPARQRPAQGRSRNTPVGPTRNRSAVTPAGGQKASKQQKQGGSKSQKQGKRKQRSREALGRLSGAATRPGSELHNYQAIVAAEFVAASLLVALTPIASRKASASASSGKLSPYVPGDLVQLVAIGIVYLILEGLAAGPRGLARFSAWFGFLILLGVGLFEATRLADLFKMLTGGGVSTVVLTGAAAPATKGESPVPPLTPGAQPAPAPKPKGA